MDRSVFDDLRWRLQEADFRSLERFAQATESTDADLRGCAQTYILELFDHMASALLENVAGLSDVSRYNTSLNDWCAEVLPEYGRDFRAGLKLSKSIKRKLAPLLEPIGGSVIGCLEPGKLAERMAHWKAEAISQARSREEARRPDPDTITTIPVPRSGPTDANSPLKESDASSPTQTEDHERETIAQQIDRLRDECRLSVEQLANELGIEPRSVYRHLAGTSPRSGHIGAYERVFSKILKQKIVIAKTSGERQ